MIKHSKFKCFLHISREAEIHSTPKTENMGIVNLLSTGKLRENRYSKGLSFLHILHSSISREIETHTIPKTWEKWIFIARETYGKTQIFQSYWFLTYFMWGINPDNSQNMGKGNVQNAKISNL